MFGFPLSTPLPLNTTKTNREKKSYELSVMDGFFRSVTKSIQNQQEVSDEIS